ncbi:MAG: hypothetical protein EPO26_17205 [Chloroflexota bacterium]|nr:MAG: hypothetical protein EPO26_17205 [Chloroflexota bacterium]
MSLLTGALVLFLILGFAQVVLAGRMATLIGGEKRNPRFRRMDVLVLRAAGGFVLVLAAAALVVVFATGAA